MTKIARWLIIYGTFLIFAGVVGYLSNPEKAKTALLSGGTFGGLSILWGALIMKGFSWGRNAAFITTGFLTLVFTWRAAVGWSIVLGGNSDKIFTASLVSVMLAASIAMLTGFYRYNRT